MDHDGLIIFERQFDLLLKACDLQIPALLIPVIIETDLTDGDGLPVCQVFTDLRHRLLIEVSHLIGMKPDSRVNERILPRKLHDPVKAVRLRGDIDDLADAGGLQRCKKCFAVRVELFGVVMCVCIYDHKNLLAGYCSGRQLRKSMLHGKCLIIQTNLFRTEYRKRIYCSGDEDEFPLVRISHDQHHESAR